MSLEQSDKEAGTFEVAPRVTLDNIKAAIGAQYNFTGAQAISGLRPAAPVVPGLEVLSICILVMNNGFTIIGKSAPASPENFNAEFGQKLAYEDAIKQVWPLMGFALRDRLWQSTVYADAKKDPSP